MTSVPNLRVGRRREAPDRAADPTATNATGAMTTTVARDERAMAPTASAVHSSPPRTGTMARVGFCPGAPGALDAPCAPEALDAPDAPDFDRRPGRADFVAFVVLADGLGLAAFAGAAFLPPWAAGRRSGGR
jgi:hypothetical protein